MRQNGHIPVFASHESVSLYKKHLLLSVNVPSTNDAGMPSPILGLAWALALIKPNRMLASKKAATPMVALGETSMLVDVPPSGKNLIKPLVVKVASIHISAPRVAPAIGYMPITWR